MKTMCCSHAQSLAAVKAYMAWLSLFYSHAQRDGSQSATHRQSTTDSPHKQQHVASTSIQQCNALITSTLDASVPLFTTQQPVRRCVIIIIIIAMTVFMVLSS